MHILIYTDCDGDARLGHYKCKNLWKHEEQSLLRQIFCFQIHNFKLIFFPNYYNTLNIYLENNYTDI